MTKPGSIPTGSSAVIDSSVLFAMGGPDNKFTRVDSGRISNYCLGVG